MVRVQIRYMTPDEKGETRTERNERFDEAELTPPFDIPDGGEIYWEWFWELRKSVRQVTDGAANPIPPSEFLAWAAMHKRIVWPSEFAILQAMDRAFCEETNAEIKDYMTRLSPPKTEGKK